MKIEDDKTVTPEHIRAMKDRGWVLNEEGFRKVEADGTEFSPYSEDHHRAFVTELAQVKAEIAQREVRTDEALHPGYSTNEALDHPDSMSSDQVLNHDAVITDPVK
jgi:hypothetical protein